MLVQGRENGTRSANPEVTPGMGGHAVDLQLCPSVFKVLKSLRGLSSEAGCKGPIPCGQGDWSRHSFMRKVAFGFHPVDFP